jgi:hypothetical protein
VCSGLFLAALTIPVVEIGEVSTPQLHAIAAESRLLAAAVLWWKGRGTSPDGMVVTSGMVERLFTSLANALSAERLTPDAMTSMGDAVGMICDAASAVAVRAVLTARCHRPPRHLCVALRVAAACRRRRCPSKCVAFCTSVCCSSATSSQVRAVAAGAVSRYPTA